MNEFQRLINASIISINGLKMVIKEPAFRTELLLTPFIVWGACLLGSNKIEMLLLIGSWGLVLIVEIINTSIEAAIDRIGTEHHELSGLAKDLASAAVFVTIMLSILTWIVIVLY